MVFQNPTLPMKIAIRVVYHIFRQVSNIRHVVGYIRLKSFKIHIIVAWMQIWLVKSPVLLVNSSSLLDNVRPAAPCSLSSGAAGRSALKASPCDSWRFLGLASWDTNNRKAATAMWKPTEYSSLHSLHNPCLVKLPMVSGCLWLGFYQMCTRFREVKMAPFSLPPACSTYR